MLFLLVIVVGEENKFEKHHFRGH